MNDLSADNLHLWRGETHVLRGVSFSVQGGECLQVTGANGSGKTTLLRALCGLVPPEEGQVRWRGVDIGADPSAYHSALAYLGHDNGLKGDLTAAENLRFGVGLRRRVTPAAIGAALDARRTGGATRLAAASALGRPASSGGARAAAAVRCAAVDAR